MKTDPVCHMKVDEQEAIATEYKGREYYFCSEGCRDTFLKHHPQKFPRSSYELIIIGGGPAGMTAAVYAATLRIDAFIMTKDLGGQAIDSTKIENYMGYDFITGPELIHTFKSQLVHSNYIDHLMSEAEKIEPHEGGFKVVTSESSTYYAKAVIVATGMSRRKLHVPGEEEFQRKGLFYGNVQDLSFVQRQDVAVVGGGNSAMQIVQNLQTVARNINIVSDLPLTADSGIAERASRLSNVHLYQGHKVQRFRGEGTVSEIEIKKLGEPETISIPVTGVFIAIGLRPNSSVVSHLVELNQKGEIVVAPDCSTNYRGLYAAGDVTNAYGKRIIIATGEGAKAALAAKQYLLDLRRRSRSTGR